MSYMLDEIRQQPDVVRRLIAEGLPAVQALVEEVKKRDCLFAYVAARGTSDNAAVYGKYLLEIENGLPVALAAPSVFTLYDAHPRLGPRTLVLGVSQSGAGPDVIEVVQRARESGALTACLVNEADSALAQVAEFVLPVGAGREISVAATKTYTGTLALFALLSIAMGDDQARRLDDLSRAADAMEEALGLDEAITAIAQSQREMRDCVVLGRGYNQATAAEAALKLTETCTLGARAYSGADFQHGPIAQVATGLPCLLFVPEGRAYAPMAELAARLRERHPTLICFTSDTSFLSPSDIPVVLPSGVPEWVSPLPAIVAAQLFAYRLSVERGQDADAPRGLSKVTRTL
jgi:glucosamine--fructose-6-phosphate aminotransferase (isomerizing)